MPLFSVIIPAYNRGSLIRPTLDAVLAQEFTDYEVIVVDDGSTDDTAAVVESYGPRVRLVRQANRGAGIARDTGVGVAGGTYVVLLDSDDLWFPWTLRVFHDVVRAHGEPAVIMHQLCYFRDVAELAGIRAEPVRAEAFADYLATSRRVFTPSNVIAVKRQVVRDAGGLSAPQVNFEDFDFLMRAGTAGGFVKVEAPYTYAYWKHPGGQLGNVQRSYMGSLYLDRQERAGAYPGGAGRRRERWRMLARAARYGSVQCLAGGRWGWAWDVYRRSLRMQVAMGEVKYILGFPALWSYRYVAARVGRRSAAAPAVTAGGA